MRYNSLAIFQPIFCKSYFRYSFQRKISLCNVFLHSTHPPSTTHDELTVQTLQDDDAGIVVIGLNRHAARNALSNNLTSLMMNTVKELTTDKGARVVIIRSLVPGVFCAGADLRERIKLSNSQVAEMVTKLNNLASAIENIPVPTIAAIDGAALGGGLEIALGCDMRTVSEDSKLGLIETKWAIMPGAGGSQRLPRLINPSLAKELVFCAKIIDGLYANIIGLVNYAVPQNSSSDAAYQKSLKIARQILTNGPLGVKAAKLAINRGLETDITTGCKIEQLCYAQVIPTNDRQEGLRAFKEKRSPKYKGE